MSLTTGGKTYQLVTEQARRISACRLTFFADRENPSQIFESLPSLRVNRDGGYQIVGCIFLADDTTYKFLLSLL